MHLQLTSSNPTVTFKLSSGPYDGLFQNVEFPSAAFDLEASYPIYENTTKYFPIRRAANNTQYTLGRTFLQEAYLIADYERGNFTVAQANFSASMPRSHIVPIFPQGSEPESNTTAIKPAQKHTPLSTGAIAGIAIGTIAITTLLLLAFILYIRHRRQRQNYAAPTTDSKSRAPTAEVEDLAKSELPTDSSRHELSSPEERKIELAGETAKWGSGGVQELSSDVAAGQELDGRTRAREGLLGGTREVEGRPGGVFELVGSEPLDPRV